MQGSNEDTNMATLMLGRSSDLVEALMEEAQSALAYTVYDQNRTA